MKCPYCNYPIAPGEQFCSECGQPIRKQKSGSKSVVLIVCFFVLVIVVCTYILTRLHNEERDEKLITEEYSDFEEDDATTQAVDPEEIPWEDDESINTWDEMDEARFEDENQYIDESVDAVDNEYIIPDSNIRYLTNSDVSGLTLREINYAKNEIYARYGRRFRSKELQDYFNTRPWYAGKYEPEDFDKNYSDAMLSDCEKKNAEFLKSKEQELSPDGYLLDK